MSVMRSVLLAGSESRWLRRQAPRLGFVKKAVRRFMPGEHVEDALTAAESLRAGNISTVLTKLGENVTELSEADAVVAHYLDVLGRIAKTTLDCQVSVKLTQFGLDIDPERCFAHLRTLVAAAATHRNYIWIDMEQHTYTDATLQLYRRVRAEFENVGVCLQSYLYRTAKDLDEIIAMGGGVRLVKGAYREPASVAYPRKKDVDDNFFALARTMIGDEARRRRFRAVFGTHDRKLIAAIQSEAAAAGVSADGYEFDLLYGIERGEQARLARAGARVRVLISYGDYWFPWYMRRLAERPANVWFVVRTMFS